ncbi:sodium-dependent transporter [Fredinandcohnia sp. QZ13]|uniref:sodium-dependent transporter n=1 Tax=Fredinandcohnia sp. QZ13 TaxID=3073144 RepID=UPI0028531BE4|nr:sodium-dependent transporter [Fredinandcohnia sp. QZ13]MDR4886160.1 sodium-dependent transporter [Fredinandcohnia sp. QZ13]
MKQSEQWSSKISFILAAAGSAIGLGAIWKFPYVAGTSGGGIFFIIFLIFTLLVGLPLLLAEFVIGRTTQKNAIESFKELAPKTNWHIVGRLGFITNAILLSFYSVVGGWILIYLVSGSIGRLNGLTETEYGSYFGETISNPFLVIFVQLVFMLITIIVVAKGVQSGIEKASKWMMPALFILFLVIIIRSITLENSLEGILFILKPSLSSLTSETILFALGQSFFALSVGASTMLTYSSYLSKKEDLVQSAFSIVLLNILVTLLAGLAIFPAVFAFDLEPDAGPVLLFNVLPTVFNYMPFGMLFLVAFLLLFLFATLTSAFSMLELIVAILTKGNVQKRKFYAWMSGLIIFLVGVPSALSYGVLSDVHLFGKSIFDLADYLVSNILLPIGAFFISLFVSFKFPRTILYKEMQMGSSIPISLLKAWFFLIRYVVPVVIAIVFLDSLGVI